MNAHSKPLPPIPPPTTTTSPTEEADQAPSNLIQRFEKRIWRYNSSDNVAKRWLLEIISCIISAFCMAAIISLLIVFKDKAPPRWLGLTISTYISVLFKIASAALLLPTSEALGQLKWGWFRKKPKKLWDFEIFDDASRGPWGAVLLLIRTKGRSLAALGAAVILFSLALDPFFQQVVDFPDRWVCTGVSSIPKVVRYAPEYGREIRGGYKQYNTSLPDQDFQAVTDKFFYNNGTRAVNFGNGTRPEIPISCPTSNCTWDPYESLAICSKCVETPQLLTFGCLTTRVDWVANLTGFGTQDQYPNGTVCGYFLNASSTSPLLMSGYTIHPLNSSAGTAEAEEALLMRALPLITNPDKRELFGGSIEFKNIRNPITDVLIVSARDGLDSVYRNETPIVHECMLTWCVKTIQSSYYLANYEENITKLVMNETAGPSPWQVNIFNYQPGVTATDQHYTQNISIRAPDLDGPNYGVSNDTAYRTANIFEDIFPSFLTRPKSFSEPMLRNKFYQKGPMQRSIKNNPWIAPANVSRHMESLAVALTNTIRSSSSSEMVHGKAYNKEAYMAVRWQWLTLPLSLLLLSVVFLVATIIQSAGEDEVDIRKTSAIATLLYGLPDDLQNKITSTESVKTPRDRAKELRVKILPKTGWRASGFR